MKRILFLFFISLFFSSCLYEVDQETITDENAFINLVWYKSYEDDSIDKATVGLYWCYSMVGASVLNSTALPFENEKFRVNINAIGLNDIAINKIKILHSKIKNTEEYKLKDGVDYGRYISLLIGASEHYYRITNVPENLDSLLSNYTLQPYKGYVNNSVVSFEHRIIEYSNQKNLQQLFLATEIDSTNNKILEFETIEILRNGQLRYGIFNSNKRRINTADNKHTDAGKPAKCMWCHESNINQLFTKQKDFSGFLSAKQFNDTLIRFKNNLKQKQNLLTEGVTFRNNQDHVQLELAYISFMEPSAFRLSKEWNISEDEVKEKLNSLPTHLHDEFSFLGNLYHRNEVEQFSPFSSLSVSSNIREKSEIEVNHID